MVRRWRAGLLVLMVLTPCARGALPDFTGLIADNSPAVVKISSVEATSNRRRQAPPTADMPEIFRDFLDRGQMPERKAYAMGSGFIISDDGYVLTNNHVVKDASEITLRLSDRREFKAKIVGVDPRSDLALLKVDAAGLPVVRFAAPGELKVGEWVVAIGSPFGLDYSASAGIVSAIGRSIPTERGDDYVPFIQTDVAINPGNSGGPLFNLNGEVVGINSQIYSPSGGSVGLSFAIPVSVATEVVRQLKEKGRVERGWLGVYIQEVDRNLGASLGLTNADGALIAQVAEGSPAKKAGLLPGDVVTVFDGKPIVEASDLPHIVGLMAPGRKVDATVVREGRKRNVALTVGVRPGDEGASAIAQRRGGDRLGLEVATVDPKTIKSSEIRGGVQIGKVFPDSPAERAGLQLGDIIVQLGYQQIDNLDDYENEVRQLAKQTPIALRIFRRGRSIFRTIELD